jgi:hypothetical protein
MVHSYKLKPEEYVNIQSKKSIIALHFTAGWPNPFQTIDIWNRDNIKKGTAYVIGGQQANGDNRFNGTILEAFDSSRTAYNLFQWFDGSEAIERATIGIEICNWGPLTKKDDGFYTYVNTKIPDSQVLELEKPFAGYKHWHAFTDEQIHSLEWLLHFLMDKHQIPANGLPAMLKGNNNFQLQRILNFQLQRFKQPLLVVDGIAGPKTNAALAMFPHAAFEIDPNFKKLSNIFPGIYSHRNFDGLRKLDVHPDPKLIKMLQRL